MQDNETEPTPADHIHDGSESAALEQQQTTDPSLSTDPIAHNSSSDEEMAPPETATLPEDDDDEDDGPVELEDPFSGSENAKPVMLDGEDEEIEEPTPAVGEMDWYILKVQSNREDSIRETLQRRIAMQGMDQWFGEVVVPKEQVTEFKSGKKRIVQKKLYPGYILVNMILSDETWFLVRETGGIGDFTGSGGKPSPMLPQDVAKLLNKGEEKAEETPKLKINFKKGDRVKINEGTFENFEGEVEQIDEANGRVTVMLSIFGRSTPVDIEYWQIETV
jgi:transcriptional antiterminator NusG